jgi:D-alanine-D-alanine ligase
MYTKLPVVLLYGLDETCQPWDVEATTSLVKSAYEALRSHGWHVETVKLSHDLTTPLKPYDPHEWIVLNLCEGSPSQDYYYARVARMLSAYNYTYTGSDYHCLDRTQFKAQMKKLMEDYDVPTPAWGIFSAADNITFDIFPAIVKPASEHCSFGITRDSVVMSVEETREQVARIERDHDCPALVEEFLDSPEYNVTVWGNDSEMAEDVSVVGISTMVYDAFSDIHDRLCTFEAKWDPASAAYQMIPAICPAPVTPALKAALERVAIDAYRAAGCRDYGRVDIRLNQGRPMALDINANCDVSPEGGFANAARSQGLTYADTIEQLVLFAMRRHTSAYVPMTDWHIARPISVPAVAR